VSLQLTMDWLTSRMVVKQAAPPRKRKRFDHDVMHDLINQRTD